MRCIDLILDYSKSLYYTDLIELAISIIAYVFCIVNKNKIQGIREFSIYPLSSSLQLIFNLILTIATQYIDIHLANQLSLFSIESFLLIEVYTFYKLFHLYTTNNKLKKILKIIVIIFIFQHSITHILNFSSIIEKIIYNINSVVVLSLASVQLYNFFSSNKIKILFSHPIFWIIVGVYIYFLATIPIFSILEYIISDTSGNIFGLYSINHIAYSILFILIVIATKCKKVMI